ncbi:unnamed protein product [Cyprideis torosa]|uniref:Tetraspanin n=1 Tax=Cyprideis torosa TaxID=163714 RepID=A0A7R8ZNC0_9CRUS|nr:unnamed protein product [Cyprideis torosa]CAG0895926.1 unnamed protein product [Cyprideis torosa]
MSSLLIFFPNDGDYPSSLVAGLAVLTIGLWLFFDQATLVQVSGSAGEKYAVTTYMLILAGVLMLTVGFLGCCGALKESQCMLGSFFVCLLVILIAQISGFVLAFMYRDEFPDIIKASLRSAIQQNYTGESEDLTTNLIDVTQKELKCCGSEGTSDWSASKFNGQSTVALGITSGVRGTLGVYNVPASCCSDELTAEQCENVRKINGDFRIQDIIVKDPIYKQGCTKRLLEEFSRYYIYVLIIAIVVLALEVIGMVISLILCCAIRRIDDYKA